MLDRYVTVTIGDTRHSVLKGTTLEQIKNDLFSNNRAIIVAAYVNNEIKELTYPVTEDCNITFIDLSFADGGRIYERSLTFLLVKAFHDIFPDDTIEICHSVSKGLFFECSVKNLNEGDVQKIENRMRELVNMDLPFEKKTVPAEEAKELFPGKTGWINTE